MFCKHCAGKGFEPSDPNSACRECGGRGHYELTPSERREQKDLSQGMRRQRQVIE